MARSLKSKYNSPTSYGEREKLRAIIAELRQRGIKPPPNLENITKFPLDSRGFFSRLDGRFYSPNDAQDNFIKSNAIMVGFGGSRGSGKTSSGAQKALIKIKEGNNGTVINPDFENLKISTWAEFREWIPWSMIVPSQRYMRNPEWQPHQPFVLAFINGVRVVVKGVKNPDSARGANVNWLWYDEAQRDIDGLAWKTAIASVRVGKDPQSWATFTPAGKDHWTYKLFVSKDIPEEALALLKELESSRPMIEFYHGTMNDNKDNLSPDFMATMLTAYPMGWLRQQEIYGEFVEQGGVLGDSSWFDGKIVHGVPDKIKRRVRYWDLAATEKKAGAKNDPDETVGTLMCIDFENNFYIENQKCGFWAWEDIKNAIIETAKSDPAGTETFVEQEPGAGGKNQVAELVKYVRDEAPSLPRVKGHRPEGDKVMRANTWFAEASQGIIYLVEGTWIMPMFDQLNCFNLCRHDDRIDSISGARLCVAPIKLWKKMNFLHL